VTPCTELAERAGLKVRHGVVVNPFLVTSDPSICAIGEIAEFEGATCGTTAAAQEQARAAAAAVAGGAPNPYRGSTPLNVLKIRGLELCSAGNLATPGPAYESIVLSDIASRYYKRCVVHRNRLVGALLVGDISELATYRNWIEDQLELDDMRSRILRSGGDGHAMEPPKGRLVCSCHNVGEENLRDAIRDGCNDLDTLCARSRAGTGCGSCRSEVDAVLRRSARAVVPAAAL
jgi:ferredoxin-nitrate reductase